MNDHAPDGSTASHFEDVLAQFLQAEEHGQRPDPQQLLESHPELADRLRAFFHDRAWFGRAAPHLAPTPSSAEPATAAKAVAGGAAGPPLLVAGSRFAGYEILGELGKGGMGVVYKARQLHPDRLVALKVIRADRLQELSERERRQWIGRFHREAQLVAALDQPAHIVHLYEVGEQEGQPYFTMRLVEGGSLAQRLRAAEAQGPEQAANWRVQEQRASARLLAQVARAVHYAHQRGVLHRDLKPANVLLDRDGQPLVTDFGLARRIDETGNVIVGGFEGTAEYVAPEQARAAPGEVTGPPLSGHLSYVVPEQPPGATTTAVDVYGLGAMLYELLTGQPPFRGATAVETLLQVLTREPVPPGQIERRLSRDLEAICLQCLRKEPQDRYPSAAALADDLEAWLAGRLVSIRNLGRLGRAWHWCRREPALAGALGFAAAALIVGTVASSLFGFHWRRTAAELTDAVAAKEQQRTRAVEAAAQLTVAVAAKEEQRKRAVKAADDLLKQERKTKQLAAGLFVNLGVQACARGDLPLGMLQLVRGLETAPDDEHLQDVVRRNLAAWRRTIPSPREPLVHPGVVAAVGFSPDGRTLWTLSTGSVRVEEHKWPDGQKRMTRVFRPEMIGDPFFAPRDVPFTAGALLNPTLPRPATPRGRLLLWKVGNGKPIETSMPDNLQVLAVSPDMRLVLTARRQDNYWPPLATVQVWDLTARKLVGQPVGLNDSVRLARFSPDSKLAVTAGERGIAFWNAAKGELLEHIGYAEGQLAQLSFSPDGRYLALVTGPLNATAGRNPLVPPMPGRPVAGTLRLFQLEAGKVHTLPVRESVNSQSALAVGPEGRMLLIASPLDVFGHSRVRLWDRTGARTVGTLEPAGTLAYAVFSADGKRLLTVARSGPALLAPGVMELWDATTARPLGSPLLLRGPALVTTASPDGKLLLTAGGEGTRGEAQLWDLSAGRPLGRPLRLGGEVFAAAFSPDNRLMATGCHDGTARLWDVQPVQVLRPLVQLERVIVWSGDGRRALVKGADDTIGLHDTATGKPCGKPVPYTARDTGIVLSPDGRTVLIGNEGKTAQLWNGVTGEAIGEPLAHTGAVTHIGFRGAGRIAVTEAEWFGKRIDGPRSLWDAETGRSLGFQKRPSTGILEIAASSDGRTLLMSPRGLRSSAWAMEAATGKAIGKAMQHNGIVTGGRFSPDGQTVLTVGGRSGSWEEARLWKVSTGELIGQPLQHFGRIRAAAFSADSKTVLTGSEDGTARLWSTDTGKPLGPSLQHNGPVLTVAVSPDSKLIATGCGDQTARLWHLPTHKPLGPPLPHSAPVSFVVFGPEGHSLMTRSNDGTVRVWEIPAPLKGTMEQIKLWAQVTTGMELDGEVARLLDEKDFEGRGKHLQDLGGVPR